MPASTIPSLRLFLSSPGDGASERRIARDIFDDLNSIIHVERERRTWNRITRDNTYYISSLIANAASILDCTQHHRLIESCFHWVMDVIFDEDDSRICRNESDENMATLRAAALICSNRAPEKVVCDKNASAPPWTITSCFMYSLTYEAIALPPTLRNLPPVEIDGRFNVHTCIYLTLQE